MPGPNQPGATPEGTQGQDLPTWLKKLETAEARQRAGWTDAEYEDAKKGYMLHADYSRKLNEVEPLRTVQEKYKGKDLAKEMARLDTWDQWHRDKWPKFESDYERMQRQLAEAEKGGSQPAAGSEGRAPRKPRTYSATPDDFYETERLHTVLGDLEEQIHGRAVESTKKYYDETVLPQVNDLAGRYLDTVLNLIKPLWSRQFKDEQISVVDVLREAGVRGEKDLEKVVAQLIETRAGTKEGGFKEGYEKGVKEAEERLKAAGGGGASPPSGPSGGVVPSWKPTAGAPKTREGALEAVMQRVTAKHGALPA